ncbi:MAG TPA: Ig-like domain-containing protein [Acidimicrobiales bacterium]|nr:Ig-like domain-containing protein [Acidimicrobiales bacterium]
MEVPMKVAAVLSSSRGTGAGRRPRRAGLGLTVAALALVVSGCSGGGSASPSASSGSGSPVRVTVSPPDGSTGVRLDSTVIVSASGGTLRSVKVTNGSGPATPDPSKTPAPPASGPTFLPGQLSSGVWSSSAPLEPTATYTVTATVRRPDGTTVNRSSTFATLTPVALLKVSIAPLDGQTVGVGMPVALYLSKPVTDHAAFEARLAVTADPPVGGAWHWFSDTELHWRPAFYWPTGEKVTFNGDLGGFDDGNGVWSVTPRRMSFAIGVSHVSTVDAATHTMTVTENGRVVRVVPVSTGRDKYPTDSGTHVVSEKEPSVLMDSATVGIPRNSPDGYYETVAWDVRISNSGEFVHAAPWSLADQGHANVSHGCVNVSPADGKWFYDFSQTGDVVNVVGTPTALAPTNGFGDWNVPWAQWSN